MTKIKCLSVHQPNVYKADKESLKDYIISLNIQTIHNYIQGSFTMIGADHDLDSVLSDIEKYDPHIITNLAQTNFLNHSLRIVIDGSINMYEIGEISQDQIELINT